MTSNLLWSQFFWIYLYLIDIDVLIIPTCKFYNQIIIVQYKSVFTYQSGVRVTIGSYLLIVSQKKHPLSKKTKSKKYSLWIVPFQGEVDFSSRYFLKKFPQKNYNFKFYVTPCVTHISLRGDIFGDIFRIYPPKYITS